MRETVRRLWLPLASLITLAVAGCSGASDIPIADAGADTTAAPGEEVTLDGSASQDDGTGGGTLSYFWRFDTVPSDSAVENSSFTQNDSSAAAQTAFTPDVPGLYGVTLQVAESSELSDLDYVLVQVGTGNHPPLANAGEDQYASTGVPIFLAGEGIDEDVSDVLSYRWKFELVPSGSALTDQNINNQGTATAAIVPDVVGLYVLTLTVSDGEAESEPDYVTVIAEEGNEFPVADAGQSAQLTPCSGTSIALDGRASYDPEGQTLSFLWEVIDSPSGASPALDDATSATPLFSWDAVGYYTLRLSVNDGEVDGVPDYLVLSTVATSPNAAPVADPGADIVIDSSAYCVGASCSPCGDRTLTLDGSSSYDPDHDPLDFQWAVITGTGTTLEADINDVASLTIPELATSVGSTTTALYEVRLTVGDCESSSSDTVTITFHCTGD